MGTVHKLKADPPAPVVHPRPYEVYYFARYTKATPAGGWIKKTRAGSPMGAIIAATRRVILREAGYVLVHGLSGAVIARIFRKGGSITILGPFGE